MVNESNKTEEYISIGELSAVTGIGVHTLRVWEKRYGAPHSKRLPSGHRRYPKKEVARLKAIASAIESGYRASKVVTATMEELQDLMRMVPLQAKLDDRLTEQDEQNTVAASNNQDLSYLISPENNNLCSELPSPICM